MGGHSEKAVKPGLGWPKWGYDSGLRLLLQQFVYYFGEESKGWVYEIVVAGPILGKRVHPGGAGLLIPSVEDWQLGICEAGKPVYAVWSPQTVYIVEEFLGQGPLVLWG